MPRGAASLVYNRTVFPFAWTVARRYRTSELTDAYSWMSAVGLPGETQTLLDVLEEYLDHDSELADLGQWVLTDLPMGRAHTIDAATDGIWAFFLLLAARIGTAPGTQVRIRFGPNAYSYRQTFLDVLGEMRGRAIEIARDFRVRQFSSVVLPAMGAAISAAVTDYESRDRDEVAASLLDPKALEEVKTALIRRWRAGFPRELLQSAGSVRHLRRARRASDRFGISAIAPRLFFIGDTRAVGDSAVRIGEDLGRAFEAGEGETLGRQFSNLPLSYLRNQAAKRLSRAQEVLAVNGSPATHCWIPLGWRYQSGLERLGFNTGVAAEDLTIPGSGIKVDRWAEWDDPSVLLLHLPKAVQIFQYAPRNEPHLTVSIEELDADQEGDAPEPRIRISAYEWVRLEVVGRYVKRIPIPIADVPS